MDAQLQAAILNHVNAVISVTRSEESLSLVQLNEHHVTTQLQEERLLKMAEHPIHQKHTPLLKCYKMNDTGHASSSPQ